MASVRLRDRARGHEACWRGLPLGARPSCLLRPCPPSGDAALSISTDRYSSALTRVPSNASALGSSMAADSSACAPAAMCSFRRGDGTEGSSTEPTIAAAQATAYTPPPRIMAKEFSEVNDDKLDAEWARFLASSGQEWTVTDPCSSAVHRNQSGACVLWEPRMRG